MPISLKEIQSRRITNHPSTLSGIDRISQSASPASNHENSIRNSSSFIVIPAYARIQNHFGPFRKSGLLFSSSDYRLDVVKEGTKFRYGTHRRNISSHEGKSSREGAKNPARLSRNRIVLSRRKDAKGAKKRK